MCLSLEQANADSFDDVSLVLPGDLDVVLGCVGRFGAEFAAGG